jgi:GNAT superfamily N-acetyltransferase
MAKKGDTVIHTWSRDPYMISTDPARLDLPLIHRFLSQESYWARGIPLDTVKRSIRSSVTFGLYDGEKQAGFSRVVTDFATFAYLADVFVIETHRGQGLAQWLVKCILEHSELQGLRRWLLGTRDAHGLYERFGFKLAPPERFMEIKRTDIYQPRAPL